MRFKEPRIVTVGCSSYDLGLERLAVRGLCTLKFLILFCPGFLVPAFLHYLIPRNGLKTETTNCNNDRATVNGLSPCPSVAETLGLCSVRKRA